MSGKYAIRQLQIYADLPIVMHVNIIVRKDGVEISGGIEKRWVSKPTSEETLASDLDTLVQETLVNYAINIDNAKTGIG